MTKPTMTCLLPSAGGYALADEDACGQALRLARRASDSRVDLPVTYGQYFAAIGRALAGNDYQPLLQATRAQLGRAVSLDEIGAIRVFGEKHGSDYHPARIEVACGPDKAVFVMNVAATDRGRDRLVREFEVLRRLAEKYRLPFLPRAYFLESPLRASGGTGRPGPLFSMFLAEWFQGYHEFHISSDGGAGPQTAFLWDTEKGDRALTVEQLRQVYQEASRILTLYYDPKTFQQIFPWHHASGDFVVRLDGAGLQVRLITARQYIAMLDPAEGVRLEEGLLFFLLNLSLRMRLDRIDGTGAVVWTGPEVAAATVAGFQEALREKEEKGEIPVGTRRALFAYGQGLGVEGLAERFCALADACDPRAPDVPVIQEHLAEHIQDVCTLFLGFRGSSRPQNALG